MRFVLGLVDSEGGYDEDECYSDHLREELSGRSYQTLSGREPVPFMDVDGPKDGEIGMRVEEPERVVEACLLRGGVACAGNELLGLEWVYAHLDLCVQSSLRLRGRAVSRGELEK